MQRKRNCPLLPKSLTCCRTCLVISLLSSCCSPKVIIMVMGEKPNMELADDSPLLSEEEENAYAKFASNNCY